MRSMPCETRIIYVNKEDSNETARACSLIGTFTIARVVKYVTCVKPLSVLFFVVFALTMQIY